MRQRRRQPEIMDVPDLDPQHHLQALQGLARINRWSGSARILWPSLRTLARQTPRQPVRILDIAMGAGDVPIRLWHRARRAGLVVQMEGCDRSPIAVAYARQLAQHNNAAVRFFECDALHGSLPKGYDVVMSSLFLHHLDNEQATDFLRRLGEAAGRLVLVNDLVRSWAGLALAYVGTRLLSASPVVHTDGLRSVEGAFTVDEAALLAERAGLQGFRIRRCWPCRFLLSWGRP